MDSQPIIMSFRRISNSHSHVENFLCFLVILMYYLNKTSTFCWTDQGSLWSNSLFQDKKQPLTPTNIWLCPTEGMVTIWIQFGSNDSAVVRLIYQLLLWSAVIETWDVSIYTMPGAARERLAPNFLKPYWSKSSRTNLQIKRDVPILLLCSTFSC